MTKPSTLQELVLALERSYLGVAMPGDAELLRAWQSTPALFLEWAAVAAPYQRRVEDRERSERLAWLSTSDASLVRASLGLRTDDVELVDHLTLVASVLGRTGGVPDPVDLARIVWAASRRSLGVELEASLLESRLTSA